MATAKKASAKPPWKRKNPKSKASATKLTPAQKAAAKARAAKAGRPYPNLVDNMAVARKTQKPTEKRSKG